MKRLLMFLYLSLVMSEAKPQRGWRLFGRKTGVMILPRVTTRAEPKASPSTRPSSPMTTPDTGTEPKHKAVVEVVPKTLVEREAECAITLQMPNRATPQGIHLYGNRQFDTPIGRTLTREFLVRDPGHTPPAALRHLPIMDSVRAMYVHKNGGPQPASPARSNAGAKKGRATPRRPRRHHE